MPSLNGVQMDGHEVLATSQRDDDIAREAPPEKSRLLPAIVSARKSLAGRAKRFEFTMQLKQERGEQFDVDDRGITAVADKRELAASFGW